MRVFPSLRTWDLAECWAGHGGKRGGRKFSKVRARRTERRYNKQLCKETGE